jgi:hypothetical protein
MLTLAAAAVLAIGMTSPQSGAVPTTGHFRLLRSTSGGRGTIDGTRYLIEDPRTVFSAGEDRQVVVFFEWQGPVGLHRCEGTWKDPSGKAVLTSVSEYQARGPRFGLYWTLSLPDTVATGTWVLETRVDGEPAGVHAFQILAGPRGLPEAQSRRPRSLAELYKQGLEATLTLEGLDAGGGRVSLASGLYVAPDLILTPFEAINGARAVRVLAPGGQNLETSDVVSWNRRARWAILRLPGAVGTPADRAPTTPVVGDRCYFIDAQSDGGRVIVEASVLGLSSDGDLMISNFAGSATLGAPVFNEYGEVAGTITSQSVVGATDRDLLDFASMGPGRIPTESYSRGGRVRPLGPIPNAGAASKTLEELDRAGEFVRPLAHTPHFVSGVMGTGIERQSGIPVAADQRWRFTRSDGQCVVFVTWHAARNEDTTSQFALFDEDGRHVAASNSGKLKLRAGDYFVQHWKINVAALKPGIYRVDLFAGTDPVWWTFFRVTG